jgi:hypothetical protein
VFNFIKKVRSVKMATERPQLARRRSMCVSASKQRQAEAGRGRQAPPVAGAHSPVGSGSQSPHLNCPSAPGPPPRHYKPHHGTTTSAATAPHTTPCAAHASIPAKHTYIRLPKAHCVRRTNRQPAEIEPCGADTHNSE